MHWQCYRDGSPAIILFLADRHWDTGELYINGTQVMAAGQEPAAPLRRQRLLPSQCKSRKVTVVGRDCWLEWCGAAIRYHEDQVARLRSP